MSSPFESPDSAERFYQTLIARADAITERYRSQSPESARLMQRARRVLPGGSTRQGVFRSPYPTYVERANGSEMFDADGRSIVDFCLDATALPLGHSHPDVVAAVETQIRRGTALFSPTRLELDLAESICGRLRSAERMVFTTSGGDAVMLALRLARAATGRQLIAKFEGSFHGSHDDVLWSVSSPAAAAGPPAAPALVPSSAGLLPGAGRTLILPFNNPAAVSALLDRHGRDLAAVIVEPIANRMGLIMPQPGFLVSLQEACARHGILLIADEILSFRNGFGGMQGDAGIRPDLTTLGKVIGGGFPIGAVAGRADLLEQLDPQRAIRVYHTGTFAANPVSMVAGRATLTAFTADVVGELNATGAHIRAELTRIVDGKPLQITGGGSMFKITATAAPMTNYRSTLTANGRWQELASLALLADGYFLTPHLHGCVATSTTPSQVQRFLDSFTRIVAADL